MTLGHPGPGVCPPAVNAQVVPTLGTVHLSHSLQALLLAEGAGKLQECCRLLPVRRILHLHLLRRDIKEADGSRHCPGRAPSEACLGQLLGASSGPLLADGKTSDLISNWNSSSFVPEMHANSVFTHSATYSLVAITVEIISSLFYEVAACQNFLFLIP